MDPSSAQNQQIMSTQSLENMFASSNTSQQERKLRSQREQALKCPRCDSTNTKFCYYNNYSLSQPRYFCKSCKRYWTKGGTLRNVPVGGGCRKAKRSLSSSSSSLSSSSKRVQDQSFPHLTYDPSDALILGFQKQSFEQLGYNNHDVSILGNPTSSSFCDILGKHGMNPSTTNHGLLDTLRSGFIGTQNMYYVYENYGGIGEVDNNGNSGMMMMLPYDREMSNVETQEMRVSGKKQEQSGIMVDSGIASWNNGFTTSSWHGLIHSPLI